MAPDDEVGLRGPRSGRRGVGAARAVLSRLRADEARLLRRGTYLIYSLVLVLYVTTWGIPEKRVVLFAFVLSLLLASRIGHGARSAAAMLLDWLPFAAVLLAYDQSRRLGGHLGLPVHVGDVVRVDHAMFGADPSVWLQAHLHPGTAVHWYDALCTLVYTSHFLATPIVAALLWLNARDAFLRFVVRVSLLSVAALVTYLVFPEAPPWLASQDGLLGPVARLSPQGWVWLHAENLNDLLARAQGEGSNPVAAMPSVHTALAVLVAIGIGMQLRSRWRWLLVLYPLAMGFTLVYDGEHYIVDIVAGVVYAGVTHLTVSAWERRRAARGLGPFDFVPQALAAPVRVPASPGSAIELVS